LLKDASKSSDCFAMPRKLKISCSVCAVDFVLAGDELPGDSVVCVTCGASFLIKSQPSKNSDEWEVEEEF